MWAQGILGLSALLGGMTQIPGAVTNFIGSELVPVLQERWGKYWIVTCGAASIFIAYLGIMIGGQKTPFWLILFMGAFEGFGVVLSLIFYRLMFKQMLNYGMCQLLLH